MSWQIDLYRRLRTREWHQAGTLFEAVEQQIPLHYAMRQYFQQHKTEEIPSNFDARWTSFRSVLFRIGVEGLQNNRSLKWDSQVRLRYVAGRACPECDGPVIRAGWSGTRVCCLACENLKSAPVVPQPVVQPDPVAQPAPLLSLPRTKFLIVRDRRELARYLKQMLGGIVSINAVERELERTHNDTNGFLQRRGLSMPFFLRWLGTHHRLEAYRPRGSP